MAIIVISDLHLGSIALTRLRLSASSENFNPTPALQTCLFGDIVDMWRRDSSGVFLENHDVLDLIIELQKKMHVYYVAGNHDFHVLKLQGLGYPIKACNMELELSARRCEFKVCSHS